MQRCAPHPRKARLQQDPRASRWTVKVAASGAAPLSRDLAQFFEAIGLPLIEGYGLTEGGVATLNPIDNPKPGSIGKALPGVEVRLADDCGTAGEEPLPVLRILQRS